MSDTQLADQFLYQSSMKADPETKVSAAKRMVYVPDNNQGSYSSGVISIDAKAALNGDQGFASLRDGYLMIPYKVSLKNSHTTTSAVAVANRLCATLKCGVWNIIDQLSVELNGKQIVSFQEYQSFWNNFRAQTGYSHAYARKHGAESFLSPDSAMSMLWTAAASPNGDGYINNTTINSLAPGTSAVPGGKQGTCVTPINEGFVERLTQYNPLTANAIGAWPTLGGLGGSTANNAIAAQFGRGAFVAGTEYTAGKVLGTWHFMLKIKLTDLHPIFSELDMMANPQLRLRLRVNQGSSIISTENGSMKLTSVNLQSGSVCPVMLADANSGAPMNSVVAPTGYGEFTLAWGVLKNSISPTIEDSYIPFTTSRLYIPFFDLENPSQIISKPTKTVRYNTLYAQYFNGSNAVGTGISATTQVNKSVDFTLSASIKNCKYIVVLPFAEPTDNYASAGVEQFQSPFDSAPWTQQPGSSLRNFQVRIGSKAVFQSKLDYDWDAFSSEFSRISAINGDLTPELSNGLVGLSEWSNVNRMLVADVSRLTERDVPQSINVSFTNAACQGTNVLILAVYEAELEVDRLTGEVLSSTA